MRSAPSLAIASHPRLPGAAVPGTTCAGVNERPPSVDCERNKAVPEARLLVQTIVRTGSCRVLGTSTTWGGCSPFNFASPVTSFTRTGVPNVCAPSRLTAL